MRGAQSVNESLLKKHPGAELAVYFVWIDMLPGDNSFSAATAAGTITDPRAQHFHDDGSLGRSFAAAFGYPDETAWDCYLLYAPGRQWQASPPLPDSYAHQLADAPAELQATFRTGKELDAFLGAEALRLQPGLK